MKFLSLEIKCGAEVARCKFSRLTVVHSENNRAGKTTLIRCIFYALGYPIPSTKSVNFKRLSCELRLETDDGRIFIINRRGNSLLLQLEGGELAPTILEELLKTIFNLEENLILANLLGAMYIDQDKGWTLLNRGKVIGGIRFSIEDLVSGLTGRVSAENRTLLMHIDSRIRKYTQMLSIARYQSEMVDEIGDRQFDTQQEQDQRVLVLLQNQRIPLQQELQRIQRVIGRNDAFRKYISSFALRVQAPNGDVVPVTEDSLVDFKDNQRLLLAKSMELRLQIERIDKKISLIDAGLKTEALLVNIESSDRTFDKQVLKLKIDKEKVESILSNLRNERKKIAQNIHDSVMVNNAIVGEISSAIQKYLSELDVSDVGVADVFTKDLKSLSGTGLHLVVFAYKIAYVKVIRERAGVFLPIVIDSPQGREMRPEVVKKMMMLLMRDFKQHQIIIATIYDPCVDGESRILLKNGIFGDGPLFNLEEMSGL